MPIYRYTLISIIVDIANIKYIGSDLMWNWSKIWNNKDKMLGCLLDFVQLFMNVILYFAVLYRTKFEQYVNTVPTVGFNCEKVKGQVGKSKGVYFTVWDIGGQDKLRPLWNTYIHHTEGRWPTENAAQEWWWFFGPVQTMSKFLFLWLCEQSIGLGM